MLAGTASWGPNTDMSEQETARSITISAAKPPPTG